MREDPKFHWTSPVRAPEPLVVSKAEMGKGKGKGKAARRADVHLRDVASLYDQAVGRLDELEEDKLAAEVERGEADMNQLAADLEWFKVSYQCTIGYQRTVDISAIGALLTYLPIVSVCPTEFVVACWCCLSTRLLFISHQWCPILKVSTKATCVFLDELCACTGKLHAAGSCGASLQAVLLFELQGAPLLLLNITL